LSWSFFFGAKADEEKWQRNRRAGRIRKRYFKVTPPSVHDMVLRLEADGFISRVPGQARSIRLLIPRDELPDLA
jgi:DNA-binding MarR family transcriptional regulator